jgi:hypothetical protein
LPDQDLRAFLSAITDRPGVVPAGFTLLPYLAAATHGAYYVLCRTWPDTAVARPGMVFTHVLILTLSQASDLVDLGGALRLFVAEPPPVTERTAPLLPLTLAADQRPAAPPTEVPASWLSLTGLLPGATASNPVLVAGEPRQFEQLLQALWQGLPAPLRPHLTWGPRFTPPATKEPLPLLVYIPVGLEAKWRGKELIELTDEVRQAPQTAVEQLLFGGEQRVDFESFLTSLQLRFESLRLLTQCQWAYEYYQRLSTATATSGDLLALVRALYHLQPDPDKAIATKQLAVAALAQALAGAAATQVFALRNLPLLSFRTGEQQLGPAIATEVRGLLTAASPVETDQRSLLDYLAETDPARIQMWWQRAARAAFAQALVAGTASVAQVAWLGLTQATATRSYVLDALPTAASWETCLSQTAPPTLPKALADELAAFSAHRGWWELSATVLGAAYAPAEALRRQILAEVPLHLPVSSRVVRLAATVPDATLVELAVAEPSPQLLTLAGERCGQQPALLAALDVRQPAWRTIWSVSLAETRSITLGLAEPAEVIQAFLAEVAGGQAADQVPLTLIAASPYANVLHLPERARLWEQLPGQVKHQFCHATLDALVEEILSHGWAAPLEAALVGAAQSQDFNTRFLEARRNEPAAVLAVEQVLHNLTDTYLRDYLTYLPTLDGNTAGRVGRLVAARRWRQSADALFSRAKSSSAFYPALQACAELFSRWEKVFHPTLFNQQVKSADAWDVLTQMMSTLYKKGPAESSIWERAGGDITKIGYALPPAEQWEAAVALLQRGGGGGVSAASLVQAALQQFPGNTNLRALANAPHLLAIWQQ